MSVNDRPVYVHQIAYAVYVGPIPSGYDVCHTCDNPPCIDSSHLFLGTRAENLADMRRKGRGSPPPTVRGEAHHAVKLPDAAVAELRELWASAAHDQRQLARRFGISQSTVWRLVHRVTRSTTRA